MTTIAWSVPVIATAAHAPAFATSPTRTITAVVTPPAQGTKDYAVWVTSTGTDTVTTAVLEFRISSTGSSAATWQSTQDPAPTNWSGPALSPDGRTLTFTRTGPPVTSGSITFNTDLTQQQGTKIRIEMRATINGVVIQPEWQTIYTTP